MAWRLRMRLWRIVGRNVRVGHDELDIVACSPDGRTLAVVEVKSAWGRWPAKDRMDEGKVQRLQRAADGLPLLWRQGRRIRIDLVQVKLARWRARCRWFRGVR